MARSCPSQALVVGEVAVAIVEEFPFLVGDLRSLGSSSRKQLSTGRSSSGTAPAGAGPAFLVGDLRALRRRFSQIRAEFVRPFRYRALTPLPPGRV